MYSVKIQNSCRCVLKNGLHENMEFETEDKAKQEAQKMIDMMKATFCQKHEFVLSEQFGDFTIFIKPRS